MKTTLKKILLITLLFSAAVPSTMQANLDLAALRSGAIEIVSFLRENPIVVGVGVVGIAVFVWKMLKEYRKSRLNDDLWSAIESNNIVKMRKTLTNGAEVEKVREASSVGDYIKQAKMNYTVLMRAARDGYSGAVSLLLEKGVDINHKNNLGYTALTVAAIGSHSEVVKLLLAAGVDINNQDCFGCTALMLAAKYGHSEVVKLLLARGAEVDRQNMFGWTALMLTGWYGMFQHGLKKQKFTNIIEQLLVARADPLVKAKDGTTVLERTYNETINEYMRKKTSKVLKKVVASQLSLELPDDIASLTLKFTYGLPECEPAQ